MQKINVFSITLLNTLSAFGEIGKESLLFNLVKLYLHVEVQAGFYLNGKLSKTNENK